MKTVMESHLEWLKGRIYISPQMEKALIEEEKLQILNTYDVGLMEQGNSVDYYNKTFKRE